MREESWSVFGAVPSTPMLFISGSCATISQLSSIVLPVARPAWRVSPFFGRASTVTSTPFQFSNWLP